MMTTTHIQPFYLRKPWAKAVFHCFQGFSQIICVLLAESVEMETVQNIKKLWFCLYFPLKYLFCNSQTGTGSTGVINCMIPLWSIPD